MSQPRTYTDEQRIQALAVLELNRGNVARTSRELGIPRPTIITWRDKAIESGASAEHLTHPDTEKTDYAALLSEALREAIALLRAKMPQMSGRDLAITTGILTDKHLDFRDGRKAGVLVDQRQQSITIPEGTTLEDLRALRDGLRGDGQ